MSYQLTGDIFLYFHPIDSILSKRLPYDVINFEIDLMKDLGVKIEHGRSVFGHDAEDGDIIIDAFWCHNDSFFINDNDDSFFINDNEIKFISDISAKMILPLRR